MVTFLAALSFYWPVGVLVHKARLFLTTPHSVVTIRPVPADSFDYSFFGPLQGFDGLPMGCA